MVTTIKANKGILFGLFIALILSACGKKAEDTANKTSKSAEQSKNEREASAAKARDSAVFGDQLKAMDKAKATADESAKATADRLKQANQ
jgi:protein involved in sex pheromone biosynthesis